MIISISSLCSACALSEAAKKQASYHYQMGLSHLGENNATAALVEFTEAEKINPDDPELQNYLGLAYYRKSKYDLAEQNYLKALALKPNYSEARNNLGVNYLEMKRWDDAIHQLKLVTEDIFYQNQDTAQINLGLAYFGKGDYPKALSVLRLLVASYPRDPRGRLNLGRVYLAVDKTDLAIEEFRKAVELYKDYANAYYNLGLAYLKIKDNGQASAAFKEVLRIAPDSEMGQLSREYLDLLK
ncbi:MAG: TPR repeat-containing [Geobacteraceae bacterium]|nr:MAG: TPR repeat-containing [Geobacteraceae bacterium]